MAMSSVKRRGYFLSYCYLLVMINQITYVSSISHEQHHFHREFCIKKSEINQSLNFVKTSSRLTCAMSCKDDCQVIWFYEENGEKKCAMKKDKPDIPQNVKYFDCQDPKRNISVYLKNKVSWYLFLMFF